MYNDLREVFWLDGSKRNIAEIVAMFPNCQLVNAENLKLGVLTKIIDVPTWKLIWTLLLGCLELEKNDSMWVIVDSFVHHLG